MNRDSIFVSGASSELGMELIRHVAAGENPPRILAHYFSSAARIEQLQAELVSGSDSILPLRCDFRSPEAVRELADRVIRDFGAPRAFIHLPALKLVYERFTKFKWDHFESDLNVQLRSAVVLLQRWLPVMAKLPSARVVFVLSSVTRGVPPKFLSMYNIVKFAQLGLMRSLASEYGGSGVTINAVSAGMADTRFLDDVPDLVRQMAAQSSPMGRIATAGEVVSGIRFLLSEDAGYVHGIELPITGGAVY